MPIHWIVIYPVNRTNLLHNQGLGGERHCGVNFLV